MSRNSNYGVVQQGEDPTKAAHYGEVRAFGWRGEVEGGQCKMDVYLRERMAHSGVAYKPDWVAPEFGGGNTGQLLLANQRLDGEKDERA